MNAFVDPELCIGCTQCAGLCPAVFRMEGVLAVAEPHRGISPASVRLLHRACAAAFFRWNDLKCPPLCSGHRQRKNIIKNAIVTAYEP